MRTKYDIIIIGSGPSGLSTALHLERDARNLGLATLILEKGHHPRFKLCAGGILPEGEAILAKLGLDLRDVPHTDVDKASFDYKGRGLTMPPWRRKRPLFRTVRRDEFDHWLVQKARERGITIQEGVKVKDVLVDENGARVLTDTGEFHAKVVVGADGSNSIVRRKVMGDAHPHVGRALEVIVPRDPKDFQRAQAGKDSTQANNSLKKASQENLSGLGQHEALFDFVPIPQGISGYVWDFPALVKGEPMRCWGIYDSNAVPKKGKTASAQKHAPRGINTKRMPLREVLAAEMAAHGYSLEDAELKGHPIRWYEPANKPATRHVLLVGDALGVGALLGEGISPALGYGRIAAQEILSAFEKNDFSFNGYKGRLLRSRLGASLWRRTFIAKLFYLFETDFWQKFIWHYFGLVAGLVGLLFMTGWENKKIINGVDRNHFRR